MNSIFLIFSLSLAPFPPLPHRRPRRWRDRIRVIDSIHGPEIGTSSVASMRRIPSLASRSRRPLEMRPHPPIQHHQQQRQRTHAHVAYALCQLIDASTSTDQTSSTTSTADPRLCRSRTLSTRNCVNNNDSGPTYVSYPLRQFVNPQTTSTEELRSRHSRQHVNS